MSIYKTSCAKEDDDRRLNLWFPFIVKVTMIDF